MILTYNSYARDPEISKETENELIGERSKAGKAKIKSEEFAKCRQDGKCYKCFNEGSDVKYNECAKHNKNLTERTVSTKTFIIVSKSLCLDHENACYNGYV